MILNRSDLTFLNILQVEYAIDELAGYAVLRDEVNEW